MSFTTAICQRARQFRPSLRTLRPSCPRQLCPLRFTGQTRIADREFVCLKNAAYVSHELVRLVEIDQFDRTQVSFKFTRIAFHHRLPKVLRARRIE